MMLAAMMLPMAIAIDWAVLPQTWETSSVVINFLRTEGRPDVVVRAGMGRVT
jgi:hypothetical protein